MGHHRPEYAKLVAGRSCRERLAAQSMSHCAMSNNEGTRFFPPSSMQRRDDYKRLEACTEGTIVLPL